MKLAVLNASSKTALTLLHSFLAKNPSKFSKVYLLDPYPNYPAFQRVFKSLESQTDLSTFQVERMHQKYYLKKMTDECDSLLYFTHNYYVNATCKNQSLKNFSEILDPSSEQTVDVVNLAEKAQTSEGEAFFTNAVATEKEFAEAHKNAKFYWTDLVYGGPTEFTDFISSKASLPKTGKTYRFVHADKVTDVILKSNSDKSEQQFYHITGTVEKSDKELATLGGSYGLHLSEGLLSQALTCPNDRHNYRLWANPPNLYQHLSAYQTLSSNDKYPDLELKELKVAKAVNRG